MTPPPPSDPPAHRLPPKMIFRWPGSGGSDASPRKTSQLPRYSEGIRRGRLPLIFHPQVKITCQAHGRCIDLFSFFRQQSPDKGTSGGGRVSDVWCVGPLGAAAPSLVVRWLVAGGRR